MSPLVLAVTASAVAGGGTAVALDDGTVWMVYDGEFEELGACEDGAVATLDADGADLAIECGDGTRWAWSPAAGWLPIAPVGVTIAPEGDAAPQRSWWPLLEVSVKSWMRDGDPTYEGWVRLRWNL